MKRISQLEETNIVLPDACLGIDSPSETETKKITVENLVPKVDVIDTFEGIQGNTQEGKIVGALAIKEALPFKLALTEDGKPGYIVPGGADTPVPFINFSDIKNSYITSFNGTITNNAVVWRSNTKNIPVGGNPDSTEPGYPSVSASNILLRLDFPKGGNYRWEPEPSGGGGWTGYTERAAIFIIGPGNLNTSGYIWK